MFIVLLRFSDSKDKAGSLMTAHNEWIRRGFEDGVFLMVGSLSLGMGGAILAHRTSRSELQSRVDRDPLVVERVVAPEILELAPSKADARLEFLIP